MTLKSTDLIPVCRNGLTYAEKASSLNYGFNSFRTADAANAYRNRLEIKSLPANASWPQGNAPAIVPSGNLVWMEPYLSANGATNINEYNPLTEVLIRKVSPIPTPAPTYTTANGFRLNGFTLAPNGCLYASPGSGYAVLKYDPESGNASWIGDFSSLGEVVQKWSTFTLGPDGSLYAAPNMVPQKTVLKLDPESDTLTEVSCPNFSLISNNSVGTSPMVSDPNGVMYFGPVFTNATNRAFGYFNPLTGDHGRILTAPAHEQEGFCAGIDGCFYGSPRRIAGQSRCVILRFNPRFGTQHLIEIPKFSSYDPVIIRRGRLLPSGHIFYMESPDNAAAPPSSARYGFLFDPAQESFVELWGEGEFCNGRTNPVLLSSGRVAWLSAKDGVGIKIVIWDPSIVMETSAVASVNNSPTLSVGTHQRPYLSLTASPMAGRIFYKKDEAPMDIGRVHTNTASYADPKYNGAALNDRGVVVFSPGNHGILTTYDVARKEASYYSLHEPLIGKSTLSGPVFGGCALMPNGKALVVPSNSNNFAVVDFESHKITSVATTFTSSGAVRGWCCPRLGRDGFVYAFPVFRAGRTGLGVLKFDYRNNTYTELPWTGASTSAITATTQIHRSAVLLESSRLIGLPSGHDRISDYNLATSTLSEIVVTPAVTTTGRDWYSAAILVGTKVYGVPYNQPAILEYDTVTKNVRTIPLGRYTAADANLYGGGTLAANGLIYMFPASADAVCEFNPANDALRFIETKTAHPAFTGLGPSLLLPSGDIAIAPHTGSSLFQVRVSSPRRPTPLQLSPDPNPG